MSKGKHSKSNIHGSSRAERVVLSALFAFFMFCGEQYRNFGTLYGTLAARPGIIPETERKRTIPMLEQLYNRFCIWLDGLVPYGKVFRYLLLWLLILCAMSFAASMIRRAAEKYAGTKNGSNNRAKISFTAEWFMILAAWSPYLILRYPAGIDWDAYHQIAQALGLEQMTSHWPPFVAWLMGGFVGFGLNVFHSVNIGVFLFTVFQACAISLILVRSLVFLRARTSAAIEYGCLAVYMFSPLYAGYMTTAVKDALFSAFVLLLLIYLAELSEIIDVCNRQELFAADPIEKDGRKRPEAGLEKKAECGNFAYVKILLTALLVCLTRNNGSFLVGIVFLVSAAVWLHAEKIRHGKYAAEDTYGHRTKTAQADSRMQNRTYGWRSLTISLLAALILFRGYQTALTHMDIRPGSIKESLSVPFQQTARFMVQYPEEVTDEEYAAIDQALDAASMTICYAPLLSDPVKDLYRESRRGLFPYAKAWIKMGLRHPEVYLDATIHNTYGFFDPFSRQLELPYGLTMGALNANENLQFTYPAAMEKPAAVLKNAVQFLEDFPLTGIFCNVQLQMWLAIWMCVHLCLRSIREKKVNTHEKTANASDGGGKTSKKNTHGCLLAAMSALSLLILVASPTWAYNGFRYTLPIVLMNPVLLTVIVHNSRDAN